MLLAEFGADEAALIMAVLLIGLLLVVPPVIFRKNLVNDFTWVSLLILSNVLSLLLLVS